jgi:hypothetical protein
MDQLGWVRSIWADGSQTRCAGSGGTRTAEQNRSEYEEAGELRGITTLGQRRQFQILKSNGDTVIGVVAKDAVAQTNGYSIGEQVVATVEETERKRATGSRVTKRLLKLRRPMG